MLLRTPLSDRESRSLSVTSPLDNYLTFSRDKCTQRIVQITQIPKEGTSYLYNLLRTTPPQISQRGWVAGFRVQGGGIPSLRPGTKFMAACFFSFFFFLESCKWRNEITGHKIPELSERSPHEHLISVYWFVLSHEPVATASARTSMLTNFLVCSQT